MPQIVTIDTETFYDQTYSLSKITTEEYVRDPKFEAIGISIKIGNGETVWYPQPEIAGALKAIDWSDKFVVAQNTAFDGAILAWRYGIHPAAWFDTLGMSRALFPHEKSHSLKAQAERMGVGVKGEEVILALGKRYADFDTESLARYGAYCINDVELTYELFNRYMAMGFPKQELKLIDLTLRMFIEPALVLDKAMLQAHYAEVIATKQKLVDTVRDKMLESGDPNDIELIFSEGTDALKKILMSNEKFASWLRSYGVEPPLKVSPATGKLTYAFAKTDEEFQALSEHEDVRVQALVAARLGTKSTIEETRTLRFIGMADRGLFPVPLRYYGAHSGRWSGQDSVNLQNLPSRGPNAGKMKKSIKPPPEHIIIDCDSSQIEARTVAWLAGQTDLVEAFAAKQDVYKIMAGHIYNIKPESVDTTQRQVGKTVVLGAGYGIGHVKLQAYLKQQAKVFVTTEEAKRIVDTYRATYPKIPELWRRADDALGALSAGLQMQIDIPGIVKTIPGNRVTLPNGLFIQYPGLACVQLEGKAQWIYIDRTGKNNKIYGGKCVENFTQAVARCVVGEQMLRIAKRYKVVLTVHDAVAAIAPIAEAEEAKRYVIECMSWVPKWATGLPLACEAGMGESYGDC